VQEHLALERREGQVPLAEYVRPTARAFGYVFSLFATVLGRQQGADAPRPPEEFLRSLGEHLGSAIVAFDCAMDRERDRRRGAFNPLPDGEDSLRDALALCRRHLYLAAEECRRHFGDSAHSRRVLLTVAGRIPGTCPVTGCQRFRSETRSRWQLWGPSRGKGLRLNEGLDPWIGVAGFLAVCGGFLACLFSSKKAEGGDSAAAAKADDVPPADPDAPVDPAAQAALAASAARTKKKGDCCPDILCCNCDCCEACDCCPSDCGGCENIDCSGCDACSGCDCNCG
jgi:hypothetical protein